MQNPLFPRHSCSRVPHPPSTSFLLATGACARRMRRSAPTHRSIHLEYRSLTRPLPPAPLHRSRIDIPAPATPRTHRTYALGAPKRCDTVTSAEPTVLSPSDAGGRAVDIPGGAPVGDGNAGRRRQRGASTISTDRRRTQEAVVQFLVVAPSTGSAPTRPDPDAHRRIEAVVRAV